jgi:signal transduction histidine kinase
MPQDEALLAIQQDAVNQMRTLASDFANFGRPPRESRGPVDLVQLAHSYAQALAPHVEVTANVENPVVLGDSGSIARALLNVLKNGVEAGTPVNVTVDDANHGVAVRVRDRGPGVNADIACRIGEPFFTTKPRGTGLGIAIVREVVTQHDGHFSLYNCLKGGVLAELWFPRRHEPPRSARDASNTISRGPSMRDRESEPAPARRRA